MENIASFFKLAGLKQSNLCNAHEKLHSEASSFLLFSLQWKDLEQHFDSTRELIQRQLESFSFKEKQLANFKSRIDQYSKEIEFKKNQLSKLNAEISFKQKELATADQKLVNLSTDIKLKEREFNMVCQRIKDVEKECEHKDKELCVVRKKRDDCEHEIKEKEQNLNGIMQLIEEQSAECVLKDEERELKRKLLQDQEKQFGALQMAIKERSIELRLKEKKLESIQNMVATMLKEKRLNTIEKSIKLRTEELEFKEKEFGLMLQKLKDLSEDLLFKESELESVKLCIKEHSKELDMQEKQLLSIQNSNHDYENEVICLQEYMSSIQKEIIECSKEWELEDDLLPDSLQKSLDSNELASVEKPLNSLSATVKKCLEGLKAQKEHFYLLRKSMDDRSQELKMEENELEKRTMEFNKKDEKVSKLLKEMELVKKLEVEKLEKANIHLLRVKTEDSDCSKVGSTNQYLIKMEQTQSLLANKAPVSSLENEQCSSNPNEKGLYLLLSEQLNGHGLTSSAILITLKKSLNPTKLVLDVIQGSFYPQLKKEHIGLEANSLRWYPVLLKQLMNISPHIDIKVKEEAMRFAVDWKSNMSTDSNIPFETVSLLRLLVTYGLTTLLSRDEILKLFETIVLHEEAIELCRMFGFTQQIHDHVQNLIGAKQFVEAVRLICGYKLDSFQPVQILKEYLKDARYATVEVSKIKKTDEEEDEAVEKEIAALKSVITCITDCNLHSELWSEALENRLWTLEMMMTNKDTLEPKNEVERINNNNCQQQHPTKIEMQQQQLINIVESQQPHPSNTQGRQPQPTTVKAQQPHSNNVEARPPKKKKRKNKNCQNGQIKCPRISPSNRPDFSYSTPVPDEKMKFHYHDSRFIGMHGSSHENVHVHGGFHENAHVHGGFHENAHFNGGFHQNVHFHGGFHENIHASNGNQYPGPFWPRP